MTSLELVDSKSFCKMMDGLVKQWDKLEDEDKARSLDGLRDYLIEDDYVPAISIKAADGIESIEPLDAPRETKRKGGRPKGSKNKSAETVTDKAAQANSKAALLAEMRRPLTKAETDAALAEVARNRGRDQQLIVNDAVEQAVKPFWNAPGFIRSDGMRHFNINPNRPGPDGRDERVSFEKERWMTALRLHGLSAGDITCQPQGLGSNPESGASASKIYTVIIG